MNQRRHYKNPPIEEALCEFRFAPGQDWDLTIPGKLQGALGDGYSGKPREQKAMQVGLHVQDGKPANLEYGEGLARVQLVAKDGTRVVGVGRDVLSVHMLRPYQNTANIQKGGWQEFEPRIATALDAYWNVAEPSGITQVGVRYINKIALPVVNSVRVEDYLNCAYLEINGLPERYANFVSRVEYIYEDEIRLVLSYGLLGASPHVVDCLLDLDVIWQQNDVPIEREMSLEVAGDLHRRVGIAFETLVTDKARELFDAD